MFFAMYLLLGSLSLLRLLQLPLSLSNGHYVVASSNCRDYMAVVGPTSKCRSTTTFLYSDFFCLFFFS